jgi:hypothetical protein
MRMTFCVSSEIGGRSQERWHIRYLYFAPLLLCHSKLVFHDLSDSIQGGLKKSLDFFTVHSSKFSEIIICRFGLQTHRLRYIRPFMKRLFLFSLRPGILTVQLTT